MRIQYISSLNDNHHNLIADTFALHAAKKGLVNDYRSFAFEAVENGETVGIICGNTLFDEVHIADLVVAEKFRGKNIGTQLVKSVCDHFKSKGLTHVTLTTLGYQAPDFYLKCGFELEFVRKNQQDGRLDKYFFIKKI